MSHGPKPAEVDAIVEAFMERSVPLLRALLHQHFAAPKRHKARLAPSEPAEVDEVTRARARQLLRQHAPANHRRTNR